MILRNIAATMQHLRANRAAVAAGNLLACAGLVGFIACSDSGITEPTTGRRADVAAPPSAAVNAATANWWNPPAPIVRGDTTINTFKLDAASGGTPSFGSGNRSRIVIPAGAICDLATSGYGPASWATPCKPATGIIAFTVKSWVGTDGGPKVTFSPDLRFAPTQTVLLNISNVGATSVGTPTIQWCTALMTQCVDEGRTDPTLATGFDPFAYSVWRRVKHLSGYNVGWGKAGATAAVTTGAN